MAPEETLKKVLVILKKQFSPDSTVEFKPATSAGRVYTSSLFLVTVKTQNEIVELFAKVATMPAELGTKEVYETEDYVYTKIAAVFEKLQDKHGLSEHRFIFPKFYGSFETDGINSAVMESLEAKGYGTLERLKFVDWEYASKSVEVLAKFHALSFAFKKEFPEEFLKVDKGLKIPPSVDGEQWQSLIDGALEAVDNEDRAKVARCLEGSVGWSKLLEFSKAQKTAVIVHSDYRPGNLMHRKLGTQLDIIPIDYQTARLGCPVSDLLYFVIMSSDQQFRKQHYEQLVEHYYQQLTLALKRLGIDANEVYPREEFNSDLKEKLPYGIYIGAMVLPYVTVAPERAPNFAAGELVPPRDELFAERFRALVQDYKQWGII